MAGIAFARRIFYRFGLFAALMCAVPFFAGWGDTMEEIGDQAGDIRAVKARFVQEKHLEMLDNPLISKGELYFRAPDSLRWEYTDPVKSILLMNRDRIRQYAMGEDGMAARQGRDLEAMRVFLEQVGQWLRGGFDKNTAFAADLKKGQRVVLTPVDKNISAVIEKIELQLTDTPGVIESAFIYEDETSYTRIVFHDTRINPKIADSVFEQAP
jgi:outer membrane lipoprotein-sorting protein